MNTDHKNYKMLINNFKNLFYLLDNHLLQFYLYHQKFLVLFYQHLDYHPIILNWNVKMEDNLKTITINIFNNHYYFTLLIMVNN